MIHSYYSFNITHCCHTLKNTRTKNKYYIPHFAVFAMHTVFCAGEDNIGVATHPNVIMVVWGENMYLPLTNRFSAG